MQQAKFTRAYVTVVPFRPKQCDNSNPQPIRWTMYVEKFFGCALQKKRSANKDCSLRKKTTALIVG